MNRLLTILLAIIPVFAVAQQKERETGPFIVARVDHIVITRTDVERYLRVMGGEYFRLRWSWLRQERLFARYMFGEALRELILDELLLQYARRMGWLDTGRKPPSQPEEAPQIEPRAGPLEKQEPLRLTPEWEIQVNKTLEEMVRRAGGTDRFAAMLRSAKLSLAYIRDRIRIRLLWQRIQREIEAKLPPISAREIRNHYRTHIKEFLQGKDMVVFREIGIRSGEPENKIETIKKELAGGKDFGEVARRHSDLASAKKGGLCRIELDSLRRRVKEILLKLKPGQFTKEPFWDGSAYTFLKLERIERARPKPLEQVCGLIRRRIRAEQFKRAFEEFVAELRRGATIEIYEPGLSLEEMFPQSRR